MTKKQKPSPFRFVEDDSKPKNEYVSKSAMLEAIKEYQASLQDAIANDAPEPVMSNKLGKYILDIAIGLSRRPNFHNYSFLDSMISDAVLLGMHLAKTFDTSHVSSNPFSYFSFAFFRQFCAKIKAEKRIMEGKYKYISSLDLDIAAYQAHDQGQNVAFIQHLQDSAFEATLFEAKLKKKREDDDNNSDEVKMAKELGVSDKEVEVIKKVMRGSSKYNILDF